MEAHLRKQLEQLRSAHQLRDDAARLSDALVLCSNDYLGYACAPIDLPREQITALSAGAGASRLISGDAEPHRSLERALADWLGCAAALLFSSGYAANVGCIAALAGDGDVIVSDALNHASIIDGCRLSRATVHIVPHLDVDAVANALAKRAGRRCWVVTETYFSMDGSSPDLPALRKVCDAQDAALIVDEAHALGVFSSCGRGLCHAAGVTPDVLIGTLGKAIGMQGAFVAGSRELRAWLWNRARSFVFSTAMSPLLAAATEARLARVIADDQGRTRLQQVTQRFREQLNAAGADLGRSHGPILPWLVGEETHALELSGALLAGGLFVQAIRPPTVPIGTARLRITLNAKLTDEQNARALSMLCECVSAHAATRDRPS